MADSDEDLQTQTVRLRRDLVRMIRTMCAAKGTKQAVVDYLDQRLRDIVVADYEEFVINLQSKQKPRRKSKED